MVVSEYVDLSTCLPHLQLHLPYIADENHDEEPELRVVCESDDPTSRALKDAFLQGPGKKVRCKCAEQHTLLI
jgi:hypothetical protein